MIFNLEISEFLCTVDSHLTNYECLYHVDNYSDHSAVICGFDICNDYLSNVAFNKKNHVIWSKASDSDIACFQSLLDLKLANLQIDDGLYFCDNFYCNCKSHDEIQQLYAEIVNACDGVRSKRAFIVFRPSSEGQKGLSDTNKLLIPLACELLFR